MPADDAPGEPGSGEDLSALPVAEFAFPGPLRDQLVAAILAGRKTTTTGLVANYEHEREPLPRPGRREALDDPDFTVNDDTLVVAEEFRLVRRLR